MARKFSEVFRRLWSQTPGNPAHKTPAVILHDPDAAKPHDLDDPFYDQKVQERIAQAIAKATRK